MPQTTELEKAFMQPVIFGKDSVTPLEKGKFDVQFNPQTLKVNYSNQMAGGEQPQPAGVQYVGSGTTKLTVELLFDTTADDTTGNGSNPVDVRTKTDNVNRFMQVKDPVYDDKGKPMYVPPGVRFQWGAFQFDGVMDSMDETLEYFSEMGVPLRSTVAISLSKQEIQRKSAKAKAGAPGTDPYAAARSGESLPQLISRVGGAGGSLRGVATANGLESLRALNPGALINVGAGASASAIRNPAARAVEQLLR